MTSQIQKQELQKAIIFDSSSIINLTLNGLLNEFKKLKEMFNGEFIIPHEVEEEIVIKPMEIKKFKLEALKIRELVAEGILEFPEAMGINKKILSSKTQDMMKVANNTFLGAQNPIHIIDSGETACLVLSRMLDEKGIKNVVCVDERTIRLLGEKPENLLEILNKKLHSNIKANRENFKLFKGFKFIRSAELIFLAYKKGIITLKNHNVLDALLYALKFNGCSISDEEIAEMERM